MTAIFPIAYSLKRNRRSRSIRITVHHDGTVRVSAPLLLPKFLVKRFVRQKSEWIEQKMKQFLAHPPSEFSLMLRKRSRREYLENKKLAHEILSERVTYFNKNYLFQPAKITIRNQKSRWGSCSAKDNINFNYKLMFLPPELRDYVVVHELCHLRELNHSKVFWSLVALAIPEYKMLRRRLKGIG